jgi:sodium/bile acid cotransporter 7
VPTTLGVGVALVRSCKGNEAVALLLTVASNMLGIVTMPLMLKMLLDNRRDVSVTINILDLFLKLFITIFVPSVLGKVGCTL